MKDGIMAQSKLHVQSDACAMVVWSLMMAMFKHHHQEIIKNSKANATMNMNILVANLSPLVKPIQSRYKTKDKRLPEESPCPW